MGNTGMRSAFFEDTMAEIINLSGQYSSLTLRRCFANSVCLSADVGAAMDPNYKEVSEYNNAPSGIRHTAYKVHRRTGQRAVQATQAPSLWAL